MQKFFFWLAVDILASREAWDCLFKYPQAMSASLWYTKHGGTRLFRNVQIHLLSIDTWIHFNVLPENILTYVNFKAVKALKVNYCSLGCDAVQSGGYFRFCNFYSTMQSDTGRGKFGIFWISTFRCTLVYIIYRVY